YDHIGESISIDISNSFHVATEIVLAIFRLEHTKHVPVPAGIDVDVAAAWGACHHIGNTIAVCISGRFEPGAELIAFVSVCRPEELAGFRGVHIDAMGRSGSQVQFLERGSRPTDQAWFGERSWIDRRAADENAPPVNAFIRPEAL